MAIIKDCCGKYNYDCTCETDQLRTQLSDLQEESERLEEELSYYEHMALEHKSKLIAMQLYVKGLKELLNYCRPHVILSNYSTGELPGLVNKIDEYLNSTPPDLSEVENLVKDAERYRWLKENSVKNSHEPEAMYMAVPHSIKFGDVTWSQDIDSAIDAAMLAAHKKDGN